VAYLKEPSSIQESDDLPDPSLARSDEGECPDSSAEEQDSPPTTLSEARQELDPTATSTDPNAGNPPEASHVVGSPSMSEIPPLSSDTSPSWPTPKSIRDLLDALAGVEINDVSSLSKEVRQRTIFRPQEIRRGSNAFPLFLAGHTGNGRHYQRYICRQQGCRAHLHYEISGRRAILREFDHLHNHDIELTDAHGADHLAPDDRTWIQELTQHRFTAAQIMLETDIVMSPQTLYAARRGALKMLNSNQAERLKVRVLNWKQMETHLLRDNKDTFCGAYCFHKIFLGTQVCRETWIVDDSSCTNPFGLPLIFIVGIDEHNLTQILAFAFTIDRTELEFQQFFEWVKAQLVIVDPETKKVLVTYPDPKAIIVDRHAAQFAALVAVFPDTGIVFCRFHLGANIDATFGAKSDVRNDFNALLDCIISEAEYIKRLKAKNGKYCKTDKQRNMISALLEILDHYSPYRTRKHTRQQTTSPGEGGFSAVKRLAGHKFKNMTETLDAVEFQSRRFLFNHYQPQSLAVVLPEVMDPEEQVKLGTYALKILRQEYDAFLALDPTNRPDRKLVNDRLCCKTAIVCQLPCCHLLCIRMEERQPLDVDGPAAPLLALGDFIDQYRRNPLAKNVTVGHTIGLRHQTPGRRTSFTYYSGRFERIFTAATRDKVTQEMLERFLEEWNEKRAPAATSGSGLRDPSRPRCKGRPSTYPSRKALAAQFQKGNRKSPSSTPAGRQPAKRNKRR
jgi:hypothetical protein